MQQQFKKIIAFDFDQTLSVVHAFKAIAGWGQTFVPAPHPLSEYGHVQKVFDCNLLEWKFDVQNHKIIGNLNQKIENQTQFSIALMGGIERIQILKQYFLYFSEEQNCKIVIITRGYVGLVNKIIDDIGLSQYVTEVFGNTQFSYGKNEYDDQAYTKQEKSNFISQPQNELKKSKGDKLIELSKQYQLQSTDTILIDDDKNEVNDALNHKCYGILVSERKGVTKNQLDLVCEWIKK